MREIAIKKCVKQLFGVAILIFVLNKLLLRPWILEHDVPAFLQIATYSIPNLIEAIVGTLLVAGILYQLRQSFRKRLGFFKDTHLHVGAVSIAALYVISQELKLHNIGGNNVYDPYDLIASVMGLVAVFGFIQFFGFADDENG